MKVLVFSDTHLSGKFSEKLCSFLINLTSQFDLIIINGDFWDSQKVSYLDFYSSRWKKLLLHLNSKKVVYIEGDHDPISRLNSVVVWWDTLAKNYELNAGGQIVYIQHGDKLAPSVTPFEIKKWVGSKNILSKIVNLPGQITMYLSAKLFKGQLFYFAFLSIRRKLKKNRDSEKDIHILGHTHFPVDDRKNSLISLGYIKYGFASYCTIDTKTGKIELIKDRY